jgi:ell wall binding domain 2 (CWB2)
VALAVDPSTGGVEGPDAVTLVDAGEWPAGIAAASLVAAPVGAPILVTEGDEVPQLTENAIRALDPQGSAATAGRQAFVVGSAAGPGGLETLEVEGANPAEIAAEIASLRERLTGKPDHLLLASSDEPAFAMPAAGWAARSGDPVLYVRRRSVPESTRKALRRYEGVPVYVLGPTSVISANTLQEIEKLAGSVERVGAEDPVSNAIEFARFASGSFGWNINDPGHGFVIANTERPLDAAVASPLSASGTWGPLLVTDDADSVPAPLRGYMLDLKPGYEQDPTRALYNHLWLIGDDSAVSTDFQAQVDEIAEVAPVSSGSGASALTPPPGTPESQPDSDGGQGDASSGQDGDQNP